MRDQPRHEACGRGFGDTAMNVGDPRSFGIVVGSGQGKTMKQTRLNPESWGLGQALDRHKDSLAWEPTES